MYLGSWIVPFFYRQVGKEQRLVRFLAFQIHLVCCMTKALDQYQKISSSFLWNATNFISSEVYRFYGATDAEIDGAVMMTTFSKTTDTSLHVANKRMHSLITIASVCILGQMRLAG
ncbi:uncharacterized protein LOC111085387 [Limulus polyphemus]|uniref:Uncharacterized protein LOC111085387 n=1 Tax=Limulus polyphemus TaxID=6850 RepID=A0ABM1S707_LIMPO|nr:uncharacterized protein LOC111085387 [Limulus polyphemus]